MSKATKGTSTLFPQVSRGESNDAAKGLLAVWKSKVHGAFALNRRVLLHAIDAAPARWRGGFLTARPSQDGRVIAEK